MTRTFLAGLIAGLVSTQALAVDVTSGAVAMMVAKDVCPAGTIDDEQIADTIELSAVASGQEPAEHVFSLAARAVAAKERLLRTSSVDAFCQDLESALAPRRRGGN